ncbi:nucleoside recognition protein [Lachnospiraceae bacterium 47-T17]
MNYLWGGMIVVGVIFGAFHGGFGQITEAAVDSAKEAVNLAVAMAGVIAMWTGLMEIAEQTGIVRGCARRLRPLLRFLFPSLPPGSRASELIAANFMANIFGLGWAATPAGLEAMQELEKLEDARREGGPSAAAPKMHSGRSEKKKSKKAAAVPKGVASREMCTFLVLNISSLQLIPVNMIAYRSQYGSVNPTVIVGPGIVATAVSTLVAVVLCKMMNGNRRV